MLTIEAPAFGQVLRQHRLAAGLTQEALAEQARLSARAISDLERGLKSRPHRDTVALLAGALQLSPHDRALFDVAAGRAGKRVGGRQSPGPARHNLPGQLTRLVGRERDEAAVAHLLRREDMRLLTLIGPGGVGKTRLAIQVATGQRNHYRDGVCFVDLAPIGDPDLVLPTIARALDLLELGSLPVRDRLTAFLRDRRMLLLLDNFEQVLAATTGIAELLAACPGVTALVTSRAALHVQGEHEFRVPPLALPAQARLPRGEALVQYAAVTLFLQRAQAVRADFQTTDANVQAVAAIAARLDGLPLAIELAAAWIRILPPQTLLARLEHRLPVLVGGANNAPARHQTMRQTIAWSYDLLEPPAQALFRRLAVFVGGGTLAAAEAVCGTLGDGVTARHTPELASATSRAHAQVSTVLEGLASLVDRSLLRAEHQADGEPRFVLLETIREYALEQLIDSGDAAQVRSDHSAFFLHLAEAAEPELNGPRQAAWYDRLEREQGNLRAAVTWVLEMGEPECGLRAVAGLWVYWASRSYMTEGREWLKALLATPAASPVTPGRAKAMFTAGMLAWYQGQPAAAQALHEESLELQRQLGDRHGIACALFGLGQAAAGNGDHATARALHEAALAIWRELGDRWQIGFSLTNLGVVVAGQGDYALARSLLEESRVLRAEAGDRRGVGAALLSLADVAADQADFGRAEALWRECVVLAWELGDRHSTAQALAGLASVAVAQAHLERGLRLAGAADALLESLGATYFPPWRRRFERRLEPVREAVQEGSGAAAWADGRLMPLDEAIVYALAAKTVAPPAQPPGTLAAGSPEGPRMLTLREREVATLIARGYTNRKIAAQLSIAERTAETHVEHILSKLGLASRAQVAVWAVQQGLLAPAAAPAPAP